MKTFKTEKVVTVYANVITDCGEFRVYSNGYVERWNDWDGTWDRYDKYENHYEEIKQIGMEALTK